MPRLYAGVRDALAAHCEAVGCHVSHRYTSGSSLYFTFLVRGTNDTDFEARLPGVGRLKAAFLAAELGPARPGRACCGGSGRARSGRDLEPQDVLP